MTHVLNAAAGQYRINTGPKFYADTDLVYHGVEAADHPEFNLRPFLNSGAQFIGNAVKENGQWDNLSVEAVRELQTDI